MGMGREGGSSGSCNYFGTSTGSGQISKDKYYYGFFNAALKLSAHFTFGAVVAFYAGLKGESLSLHTLSGSSSVEWVQGSLVAQK
ncbi:putative xyloglucan endotransglucosylase/hydrolase protein 33 [Capsicum chinense]|nr:putative xyloglucan endotransglucosylase/hydrolase protein 33 [Capsicum chinense]